MSGYSREAAVQYARTYALNPNPNYRYFKEINNTSGDCANFLSQCLRAGGGPMVYSNNQWWYSKNGNGVSNDTWSVSWAVAHSLYWFLKINEEKNLPALKGREVGSPSLLEPGDVVFFENWSGVIYHSAMVTAMRNGMPLISHHTFEALNIPISASHGASRYHYLKIHL